MTPMLKTRTARAGSQILAYGAARGDLVVTNDEIAGPIDSSDEWIRQRTGIVTRVRASAERSLEQMAEEAAREALETAGVDASELDAIIVATVSFPYPTPSLAAKLAGNLGADHPVAFDVSAACAGFAYAVGQADSLIRSGDADKVLVVGAEKLSDFIDPTDRTISFILADGAGAVVMGASDVPKVGPTLWGADGDSWDAIYMSGPITDFRDGTGSWPTIAQNGRAVFRWAVWHTAEMVKKLLADSGLTVDDVDAFVPHQANMRIIDELVKQLELPDSVVIGRDIAETGNTSAASIPLATHRLIKEGAVKSGDVLVQFGFGAGLAYAGQVVIIP